MTNADMSVIRDFEGGGSQHLSDDDDVNCLIMDQFTSTNRCPVAMTLAKAGLYRDNNTIWLSDFRKVLIAMVKKGL